MVIFVWKNEENWPVEFVSENLKSLYGYESDQYTSNSLKYSNQIHPDDIARVAKEVESASIDSQCHFIAHEPYRYLDAKNLYRWVKDTTNIIRDNNGSVTHYVGYIMDISNEINLQKRLEQHLSQNELIWDAINDGWWDWDLITNNVYFSKRWKEMLGYQKDEFPNDAQAFFDTIHPDDKEALELKIKRHFDDPDKVVYSQEIRLRCKDGSYKWILTRGKAYTDTTGKPIRMVGSHSDLSNEHKLQRELLEEHKKLKVQKEEFETIFNISKDGIAILDMESNFLDFNEAYLEMTSFTREELLATSCIALSVPEDRERAINALSTIQEHGYIKNFEKTCIVKHGRKVTINMTVTLLPDKQRILISTKDVTAMKQHERELEYIAHYDSLTGLPNRVLKSDRLRQAMFQAQRRDERVAVLYLDLDGFKEINDSYGHDAGDQLLVSVSTRMKEALREGDTLSRLGGDEFVAILVNIDDSTTAIPIIQRLLEAASEPVILDDHCVQVSASIGVTFYPQSDDVDADQLIRQADQAMYGAKQSGKNRYNLFDPEHDKTIRTHHENIDQIQHALAHDEFLLYYQPKINMRTNQLIGAEALIRWNHPTKGLVYPLDFLPTIENHPLAIDIGEWVIETAIEQIEQWQQKGLTLPISINVGAKQLLQDNFHQKLESTLARHPQFDPSLLEIEVLETSALEDINHAAKTINACKMMGIHFALDDFGTGYSSLSYLKRLPVATLKIDQSFVRDMLHDADDMAILEGIIGLASTFKRDVIAEGVESIDHAKHLRLLGCELAQGYGIAKPMPANNILPWAKQWSLQAPWLD